MGFTESLLSTGEVIEHRQKQHWFVLVWEARLTIAAIVVAVLLFILAGNTTGTLHDILSWVTAIIFIGGLLNLAWSAIGYLNHVYLITNRRVIQVSGVLNKTSTDSSLEKINDAVLTQSIFGRIFGFGDLEVLTASEVGIDKFKMIVDPIGFKKAMLDAKHEYEVDMERAGWPPSPPLRSAGDPADPGAATTSNPGPQASASTAAPSAAAASASAASAGAGASAKPLSPDELTRTLANLADLRDRGAISADEYEAKKADLLGRL